jgi:hypothetical protein
MEKLLKELISDVRNQTREIEKFKKEIINYLAFQSQIQKQILNNMIKLNTKEELNGDN